MDWWKKLSFRWILLFTPVITFGLVMASFGLLNYLEKTTLSRLELLQSSELSKAEFFSGIGNDISQNHVRIYEHMRSAQGAIDEGDFYDEGKPLLLAIHDLEERLQIYIDEHSDDVDISPQLNTMLKNLVSYRNNTTNALLMATVDLKLAQDLLRDSTRYYVELNNQFLEINQFIQARLSRTSASNYKVAGDQLGFISLALIGFIGVLIVVSFAISRNLSRSFHERIVTLRSLFTGDQPGVLATPGNNELDILSSAVNNVKANVEILENARQKLGQQERSLRTILDTMINAVITIDETGIILTFNKRAETMFGFSADEVVGEKVNRLMPEPYASRHDDYLQHYLATGEAHVIGLGREAVGKRKNQECFPMLLSVAPLPQALNDKRSFIGSCQDITLYKQQEKQLRHSQKMDALDKLTGGIAHDYNNLLGIILGYAELLIDHTIGDSKLEKYARDIQHAAERGASLTKKLLRFSQYNIPNATVININKLAQEQQLMLEKILTVRIKLVLDLAEDLWPVELDSGDLEDAMVNMSINALHAIEGSGRLTIRTSNEQLDTVDAGLLRLEAGDYVLLSVTDTGCGMDEVTKEKIFDPFYTTKGNLGTGLGLSQVYGFIERSSGAIKVYSELGRGSCFALYFPRSRQSVTETQTPELKTAANLHGNETLLVVDDEQAMVEWAREILIAKGYRVLCANNGKQALDVLEKETVDLMISDVIMPDMDGYQLSSQVRQRYPYIKIQIVSGFADDRHNHKIADETLRQNMLYKPYVSNTLLLHVRNLLDENPGKVNLAGRTILVMDDEVDIRELFELNLEKLGCNTLLSRDGDEAITLVQQSIETGDAIDAIILDLSIPGSLNGKDIADKIRAMDPNARIIVSSGYSEGAEMVRYRDYGFDGAIEKVFNREEIERVLQQVLSFPSHGSE